MSIAEFLKDPKKEVVRKGTGVAVEAAAKLRKQVFTIFGSVVVLGLALAGWYVAYRIVAEGGTRTEGAPVVTIPAPVTKIKPAPAIAAPAATVAEEKPAAVVDVKPAPVAEVKPSPVTETKPAPVVAPRVKPVERAESATHADTPVQPATPVRRVPFERHDVNPRHGEKYWQIAAYGPKSLDAYLKNLKEQGRHPLVAPGPAENIYRILVGPFKDADALEQARRSIEAMGIEPILRSY